MLRETAADLSGNLTTILNRYGATFLSRYQGTGLPWYLPSPFNFHFPTLITGEPLKSYKLDKKELNDFFLAALGLGDVGTLGLCDGFTRFFRLIETFLLGNRLKRIFNQLGKIKCLIE